MATTAASADPMGIGAPSSPGTPWPVAGTAEFARVDARWRSELAAALGADLQRHVMDAWFPRSIDLELGGFESEFDRRWHRRRASERILEFQARQTRTAARIGIAFPAETAWQDTALHGLRYLAEVMHDEADGGWFWRVDTAGRPMAGGSKHAHSTAYLIGAGVALHRLTGSDDALDVAREGFEWL